MAWNRKKNLNFLVVFTDELTEKDSDTSFGLQVRQARKNHNNAFYMQYMGEIPDYFTCTETGIRSDILTDCLH